MIRFFRFAFITLLLLFITFPVVHFTHLLYVNKLHKVTDGYNDDVYISKVSYNDGQKDLSVRLLILKHSIEQMANDDAKLAVQAANVANLNGLDIQNIGEHFINRDGEVKTWGPVFYDMSQLKEFVKSQAQIGRKQGDTLIIFTIGHGSPDGQLHNIGQREILTEVFSSCAEELNQEVVWWQLSCYAQARLPSVSTLNSKRQSLFSIINSSDANTPSNAYVQGWYMQILFSAMAQSDPSLDVNNDGFIQAKELKDFMNRKFAPGFGNLMSAKNDNEVIFGGSLRNILDQFKIDGIIQKGYVPFPN